VPYFFRVPYRQRQRRGKGGGGGVDKLTKIKLRLYR